MERTITRIKNLKARRKLSLPASPNPTRLIPNNSNQAAGTNSSNQDNSGNVTTLPYSRIRSLSPDEFEKQTAGGRVVGGGGGSQSGSSKGGAQRTVSERYRKVQWSPEVRSRLGELEAIRQSLRNGEVSGRAESNNNPSSSASVNNTSSRRASLSVRAPPPSSSSSSSAVQSAPPPPGGGSGRYRRSDSVSMVDEESVRGGRGRNHTRHGSLPHVFRNLYLHPPAAGERD